MNHKVQYQYLLSTLLLVPVYTLTKHDHHHHHNNNNSMNNTVVATINTGISPTSIAITPNGRVAYVTNSNNFDVTGQDSISVLNLRNNTLTQTINDVSFDQPSSVTLNAAGTRAYVTNSNSTTVSVIDTSTNQVTNVITGFNNPSAFAITPSGRFAYVSNFGTNTISMVDLNTNMIVGSPITVGQAPTALAVSPNGAFVYAVSAVDGEPNTGTLSVIRTSDNMVANTITGFSGPSGITLSSNGQFAYVSNFGNSDFDPVGSTVSVVNLSTQEIVSTIDVGLQPTDVAITSNGRLAYVANFNTFSNDSTNPDIVPGQGTVNIIDTRTNQVVAPTIAVGQSPSAIELSPNNQFAYVTNSTSNTVDVIQLRR